MILRRASLLKVGDWVRLEVTGNRWLWQIGKIERVDIAGHGELQVSLSRPGDHGEPWAYPFLCFLDDLVEIMPQPLDDKGRR